MASISTTTKAKDLHHNIFNQLNYYNQYQLQQRGDSKIQTPHKQRTTKKKQQVCSTTSYTNQGLIIAGAYQNSKRNTNSHQQQTHAATKGSSFSGVAQASINAVYASVGQQPQLQVESQQQQNSGKEQQYWGTCNRGQQNSSGNLSASQQLQPPLNSMKQSQRGSKVHIIEQGGSSSQTHQTQQNQQPVTKKTTANQKRTTTGIEKQSSSSVHNSQILTMANTMKFVPSITAVVTAAAGTSSVAEKKFKKTSSEKSGVSNSTAMRRSHELRQKSFKARLDQASGSSLTMTGAKNMQNNKGKIEISPNMLNTSGLQNNQAMQISKQESIRSTTIKLVTIPLNNNSSSALNNSTLEKNSSADDSMVQHLKKDSSAKHKQNNSSRQSLGTGSLKDSFQSQQNLKPQPVLHTRQLASSKTLTSSQQSKTIKRSEKEVASNSNNNNQQSNANISQGSSNSGQCASMTSASILATKALTQTQKSRHTQLKLNSATAHSSNTQPMFNKELIVAGHHSKDNTNPTIRFPAKIRPKSKNSLIKDPILGTNSVMLGGSIRRTELLNSQGEQVALVTTITPTASQQLQAKKKPLNY